MFRTPAISDRIQTFLGAWCSSSAGSHPLGSLAEEPVENFHPFQIPLPFLFHFPVPSWLTPTSALCDNSWGHSRGVGQLSTAIFNFLTESSPAQGLAALPTTTWVGAFMLWNWGWSWDQKVEHVFNCGTSVLDEVWKSRFPVWSY